MKRTTGISIAAVTLLIVGTIGGAVALGVTSSASASNNSSPTASASHSPKPSPPPPSPDPAPEPVVAPDPAADPDPDPDPAPVEAETPRDTYLGYDARQLWDDCSAKGIEEFPGSEAVLDYDLRYFQQQPDGRPVVYVSWGKPDEPELVHVIWICIFGGDTSAPELQFFNAKDI
jgi:hypothetical protein